MKKNLRYSLEHVRALEVTGMPTTVAHIPAGHRLVLVDDGRYLTHYQGQIWHDGVSLATVSGTLLGVHRVGDIVVVAGSGGFVYLLHTATGYNVLDLSDAMPLIAITQQDGTALTATIPAMTFATPYTLWRAPLEQSDVSALTTALRTAWRDLNEQATAAEAYVAPIMVRYGVRLWDDTYLCMSEPVTLGASLTANAPEVVAEAEISGSAYTGLQSATATLQRYTIGKTVRRGISQSWRTLVKSVDLLVAGPAQVVSSTSTVNYRCITSSGGQRVAQLAYGFPRHTSAQVMAQLPEAVWTVIDTTTDFDALSQGQWVSAGVTRHITLTPAQCEALSQMANQAPPVATMACNGRLYCATDAGRVTSSVAGNPLVVERERVVTGTRVLALAAVPRSLYSGGFGRYPVYLFTDEGIYALPLTSQGAFGEPRLVHRQVIDANVPPVEGDRDIYFVSQRGHLCRLRGSETTVLIRQLGATQLAYDREHRELWLMTAGGQVKALLPDDTLSERTLEVTSLYSDVGLAMGVTVQGTVLDLTDETASMMPVEWVSEPVTDVRWVTSPPRCAVWDVEGDDVDIRLEVLGERGMSCHGFLVSRLSVQGRVAAPLVSPLFAPPLRTVRFRVAGQAATGTLIFPAKVTD